MSRYSLLVSLHVASVIVWLGCGTTLAFITIYAQRARNGVVLGQLGALARWLTLWILVPASLAAPGFGVLAAHAGHWAGQFYGAHNLAVDSKGNLFITETYEGKRVQKFVPK